MARAVVLKAVQLGADQQHILREAGLPDAVLRDNSLRLTAEQGERVWRVAIAATNEPAIGFLIGKEIDPTQLGAATTLFAAAADLSAAMGYAVRYAPLIGRQRYRVRCGADDIQFSIDPCAQRPVASNEPGTELSMAAWSRMAQRLGGAQVKPRLVRFRHRRPGHGDLLERHFACPVRFDAGESAISFALEDALRPSSFSDPSMVRLMCGYADGLLAQLAPGTNVAEAVGLHLQAGADLRAASAASTAEALGMSPRTMYRRLRAEGDSYQAAIDRVRHQRCLALLEDGQASPSELAALLGFAETSSFYRAFRRWTRRSFGAFRDERRARETP